MAKHPAAEASAAIRAVTPQAIPAGAEDYPAGLRDLADPPVTLHVLGGALPAMERAIAIVGARAATPYGLEVAHRLAADLAHLGFVIVSGLARGIDAAAHAGALDAGGSTVAVLPGGLDQIAPTHHTALARRIQQSGALTSEHPAGTPVYKGSFLTRNRLIAALSAATVVVEAAERSGALSTAATARRLKRVVLAVPGDVDRETSRGCHALLRSGAQLCESAADVLVALEGRAETIATTEPSLRRRSVGPIPTLLQATRTDVPSATSKALAGLSPEPRLVEDVARIAGLSVPETLAALVTLEWSGVARALPGQRWARR